jgi:hypothetical protein
LGSLALTLAALKDWFAAWKEALKEWNMQESQFVLDLQLETKRQDLKRFLAARFGVLPPALGQQIEAITDPARMDALIWEAGRVKQLDEFSV